MDVTLLFKACVKTVRTTNKTFGEKDTKTNILKTYPKDNNVSKAREIVKQISNLQDFLLQNRAAYLNVVNYLSTNRSMNEIDREHVDVTVQDIITTCSKMINDYKQVLAKENHSSQKREHYSNVINTTEKYLKNVSKVYTEAKAIRVKRVIETHKLSKLETKATEIKEPVHPGGDQPPIRLLQSTPIVENIESQLSAEEMQMFEEENDQLFNELNSLSDEVRQIESKVIHIAELQELFTDKVLQQEKDLEQVAMAVATGTDNMKSANEQIRQAIQRNAGLRVWVLFFLLVMSFSLLFLDWYND